MGALYSHRNHVSSKCSKRGTQYWEFDQNLETAVFRVGWRRDEIQKWKKGQVKGHWGKEGENSRGWEEKEREREKEGRKEEGGGKEWKWRTWERMEIRETGREGKRTDVEKGLRQKEGGPRKEREREKKNKGRRKEENEGPEWITPCQILHLALKYLHFGTELSTLCVYVYDMYTTLSPKAVPPHGFFI